MVYRNKIFTVCSICNHQVVGSIPTGGSTLYILCVSDLGDFLWVDDCLVGYSLSHFLAIFELHNLPLPGYGSSGLQDYLGSFVVE